MPRPQDRHHPRTRPPAHRELSLLFEQALEARRMSLTQLREVLLGRGHRVSLSTLGYWRSGERRPESSALLDALAEIEDILLLEPGHLLHARGPSRRTGPRPPAVEVDEVVPADIPLEQALATLGLADWRSWVVEDGVNAAVDVDERARLSRASWRTKLRALQDDAQHYPVFVFAGQPIREPLVLESTAGCRVTGEVHDDDIGLAVWRLTLPRPLQRGESALIEHEVAFAELGEPDTHCIYHALTRLTELTFWVRFHTDLLPSRCELLVDDEAGCPQMTEVDVSTMGSAHLALRGFGPGRAGVVFEW